MRIALAVAAVGREAAQRRHQELMERVQKTTESRNIHRGPRKSYLSQPYDHSQ